MDKGLDPTALAESSEDRAFPMMHSRHKENTKHEQDKPNEHESSEPLPGSGNETCFPTTQIVVFKNPNMEIRFLETAVEIGLSRKPAEGEDSNTSHSFLLPKKRKMKGSVFHKPGKCYFVSQKCLSQLLSRLRIPRILGRIGHPISLKHNEDEVFIRRKQGVIQKDFLEVYQQPSPYIIFCCQDWVWRL